MPRVLQRYRILRLLHERGRLGITRWDAAREVGCFELSAAIIALEAEGVVVPRKRESGKNRYGDRTTFARYRFGSAPPDVLARAYADVRTKPDPMQAPLFDGAEA